MDESGPNHYLALNTVLAATVMPDGEPMQPGLKHTLLTLAAHTPDIWPSQHRLAVEMCVTRATVNRRLRALEDAKLIYRVRRGRNVSTVYRLNLSALRELRSD